MCFFSSGAPLYMILCVCLFVCLFGCLCGTNFLNATSSISRACHTFYYSSEILDSENICLDKPTTKNNVAAEEICPRALSEVSFKDSIFQGRDLYITGKFSIS